MKLIKLKILQNIKKEVNLEIDKIKLENERQNMIDTLNVKVPEETDVDNKIRIIQSQSGSQEEINQYILFKNQLIQRKQALINQQITK